MARNDEVTIDLFPENIHLKGFQNIPEGAEKIVIFAHGSGSGRHSPRNQYVAGVLQKNGIATLLLDLLTPDEELIDEETRELRFNIPLLAKRLVGVVLWAQKTPLLKHLKAGFFGASTGSAAALMAASSLNQDIFSIVSRGGRPDLALDFLHQVKAPTLLIVGGDDTEVIELNKM